MIDAPITCTVIAVHDADTIRVSMPTGPVKLRLSAVGAVESDGKIKPGQPFGTRDPAKALRIVQRLALGKSGQCYFGGQSWNRRVGRVVINGRDLSASVICSGAGAYWAGKLAPSGQWLDYDPGKRVAAALAKECRR